MKHLIAKSLENAISYPEYRTLVHDILADGKSTGSIQSEALTNYSLLNDRRMKRLDKTIKITDETKAVFKSITEKQTWLVLTEGWCGDAAQNLPVIHKLAAENENIALKIVLRDEHLELMDLFLTNGGRSIPKVIVLDAQNNVNHTWGPRPTLATKIMAEYKAEKGSIDAQFKQDLQVWYNKNKGLSVQEDFVKMIPVL
jgi:hypothetical protein|tara:strand:+ start:1879 stop:2475 length:597 start_codon:yes stop_codon:yes gene_type:complete